MPLIVEDGTIVAGANSYVTQAEYQAFADVRGYAIGASSQLREKELTKAMDYLESYRDKFKGTKVRREQTLQWPRVSVFIDGYQTNSNQIPVELKKAQMELAFQSTKYDLAPSGQFQNVQSQTLETLSVSYFNGGSYQSVQLNSVSQFLRQLIRFSNNRMAVRA
jgi:flagellar biosynthesis regulator FlaF